ncbi:MAG: dihydrofolate reductase [Pseudorhodoplanes sp.]|nr:dihydrofolate reductase [Pseudorhodoplanes sp.]
MASGYLFVGFVIVSRDGMIADAAGVMPPDMIVAADQRQFERELDTVAAVIHGRHSQEHFARSPERRRLVATRGVAGLAPHPDNRLALLWNPAGIPAEAALQALGVGGGRVAIIGGTELFGLFLPRYDAFYLSRADDVSLPGGRPVFPEVPRETPEQVLRRHGLYPNASRILDPARGTRLVIWSR